MLLISSPALKKIGTNLNQDSTHLSLGFAARRFAKLATQIGIEVCGIDLTDSCRSSIAMDYYRVQPQINMEEDGDTSKPRKTSLAKEANNPKVAHLSLAAWTDMRLVTPADMNIAHLSWEQTYLADTPAYESFGTSMSNTLKVFDRIWACADFVSDALKAKGLQNVTTFPTPICLPQIRSGNTKNLEMELRRLNDNIFSPYLLQGPGDIITTATKNCLESDEACRMLDIFRRKKQSKNDRLQLFITQGNTGDARKGLFPLLIGFGLFAASFPGEAYLVVKTSPRTRLMILDELNAQTPDQIRWGWWGSKNILFLPGNLTDEAQKELYSIADYYICCPVAEGQNVPLQEAIQCGCYPIAPLHTAMAEYLTEDLISKIPTEMRAMDPLKYCGFPLQSYEGHVADCLDIADACQRAVDTNASTRDRQVRELQEKHLQRYTDAELTVKLAAELGLV